MVKLNWVSELDSLWGTKMIVTGYQSGIIATADCGE